MIIFNDQGIVNRIKNNSQKTYLSIYEYKIR